MNELITFSLTVFAGFFTIMNPIDDIQTFDDCKNAGFIIIKGNPDTC